MPFPTSCPKAPAASYGGQIILEELRDKAGKDGRRSLSSVSGYPEKPSQEYSPSLEQLHRSSSLSRLAEMPEGKERNGSRGWNIPWRWSRMQKAHQRKPAKVAGRQSSDQFNRRFMTSSLAVDPTFSSEDLEREETGTVIEDKIFVSASNNSFLTVNGGRDGEHTNSSPSLCLKYQPKVFEDIVGHEIIVQAISGAIQRKRISSLYLFHGPNGTGKSSTAKILAMALNCELSSPTRPCWICRGCSRSLYAMEMCSGSRFSGFEKVKTLIQRTSFTQAIPGLKVFILKECHLLTAEAWDELLSIVEGPYGSTIVFILITMSAEGLPASISSRCQKYCFPKLRDRYIERKLTRIAIGEGIGLEREALELIIAKAGGSLREAENILDQLTLLDRRITTSMVQQIVHLIPREKLNQLLMAALSGDTMKTIKLATELIGSGVEPQALMSQLASVIKDLLSTAAITASGSSSTASAHGQPEKLCYALKVFVGMKQQPRSFIDQNTQIFAALLQIASPDDPKKMSRRTSIPKDMTSCAVEGDEVNQESLEGKQHRIHKKFWSHHSHKASKEDDTMNNCTAPKITEEIYKSRGKAVERGTKSTCIKDIEEIWLNMVENIQNRDMKEFLSHHAKLASLTISSANAIVHLLFRNPEEKTKADMSEESISSALQSAIGCPVTVNMSLQPLDLRSTKHDADFIAESHPAECSHSRKEGRAGIHQNNIHSTTSGVGQMKHLSAYQVPSPQSGPVTLASYNCPREERKPSILAPQRLSISELSSQKEKLDIRVGQMKHLSAYQVPSPQSGPVTLASYNCPREERKPSILAPQRLSISELSSQKEKLDIQAYQEMQGLSQSARAQGLRIENHKHRWLSASSIPQSDVSVEPYSQDILFEDANKDRYRKARKNPKVQKRFSKAQEEHYTQFDSRIEGLDRSWSCTEIFCQQKRKGENHRSRCQV